MIWFKKSEKKSESITSDRKEDIIALREDGLKPSEISQELGISSEKVSRVLMLERRKMIRRGVDPTGEDSDPVREMQIEIKKLELEKKRQELQWAVEDRQAERAMDLAEDFTDDQGNAPWWANIVMPLLQSKFMTQPAPNDAQSLGIPNTSGIPPDSPPLGQVITPPAQAQYPKAPIDLSDEEIDEVLKQYPRPVKRLRDLPSSLVEKTIRANFPNFSDLTYQRVAKKITGESNKQEVLA